MNFGALPERLAAVRAEIARRQGAGRWTHPVTIVAVTKGFGLDAVQAALEVGLTELGENRVQGAVPKIDDPVGRRASWHLIVDVQRRTFGGLRRLRDALQEDGLWLPALSMGMSADYATAVEEGTTMIRLGTALFGPRQP